MHVDSDASALQAGGNMEGKEVRFGIANSALFATITTDTSCGAVNTMHDSLLPLAGMIPMVNIMLGEIIFGGVGSGLYGMLAFAIIAVFVAGLMVGSHPEYLGKKIEAKEVKMAMLAILILPLSILGFTAIGGGESRWQPGRHEQRRGRMASAKRCMPTLSATGNNGSAFAGLSANVPFWNATLGIAMLVGRFLFIVPMLAVAGSLAAKKIVPAVSAGTFPTDGGLFVGLVVGRDPHRGRVDLLPGPGPRPRRRTPGDARRHVVLIKILRNHPRWTALTQPARLGRRHARPGDPAAGARGHVPQARPAVDGPQPRHVRGGGGGGADHGPADPRHR